MSQEVPLTLKSQEGTVINFPRRFLNYSVLIQTMSESDGEISTDIPTARINKFLEFCAVMSDIDETPEKVAARVAIQSAREEVRQAESASQGAFLASRQASREAEVSAAAGGGAAGGGAGLNERATRKAAEAKTAEEAKIAAEARLKEKMNAASPVPLIKSGNLAEQFASLDARYRALLASLIQPVAAAGGGGGGGAGAINGDLLADMIQDMNFLDCKPLLNLLCGYFCLNFLNGKTADQVRTEWGIINDFTPEEQAAIAAEEAWLNA